MIDDLQDAARRNGSERRESQRSSENPLVVFEDRRGDDVKRLADLAEARDTNSVIRDLLAAVKDVVQRPR